MTYDRYNQVEKKNEFVCSNTGWKRPQTKPCLTIKKLAPAKSNFGFVAAANRRHTYRTYFKWSTPKIIYNKNQRQSVITKLTRKACGIFTFVKPQYVTSKATAYKKHLYITAHTNVITTMHSIQLHDLQLCGIVSF